MVIVTNAKKELPSNVMSFLKKLFTGFFSHKYESVFVVIAIVFFIVIRSIHFTGVLNFSHDQGLFASKALEIWREKKIVLLGPTFSINFRGRYAFHGSAIYYFQIPFFLLADWDPAKASYFFMLFAGLMCLPLFYGVKWLAGEKVAWIIVAWYLFAPMSIDFTRFLWNPNSQFAMLPFLLLAMGLFKKKETKFRFFFIAICSGFLLQFHYQFVIILLGIFTYYFFVKRVPWWWLSVWIAGFSIGFAPLIIFELRNDFYNIRTVWLFLSSKLKHGEESGVELLHFQTHYVLSVVFAVLLLLANSLKKRISPSLIASWWIVLAIIAVGKVVPTPVQGFGMAQHWQYEDEEKIYRIITDQNLENYNVVNLAYDTLASVTKYFHLRDNKQLDEENYTTNKYLFVVSPDDQYMKNPAYEVNTFAPSELIQVWSINEKYSLYLLKRLSST